MSATQDYATVKREAQAIANRTGKPHWLFGAGRHWWISHMPRDGAERIDSSHGAAMNAGTDYQKAKAQAQANADYTKTPRWLHFYGTTWWVSQAPVRDAERVDPAKELQPRSYC